MAGSQPNSVENIPLTAEVIEGFVGSLLVKRFDGSLKIPKFHKEWWNYCCGPEKYVAIAAPRSHAKSTAITLSFTLASILFRKRKFVLIVSDTESQACLFLGAIKQELSDNQELIDLFGVKRDPATNLVKFEKDSESDVIIEFEDGYKCRLIAKGSEQKLRGLLWDGKRPDLMICHEKDTEIYTPETGWIKNQDYPDSKVIKANIAYKVEFEDGTTEIVSEDHRYLTKEGWKFAWMLKPNENVEENITDATMNAILNEEKKLTKNTTLRQKLKNDLSSGLQTILISIMLLKNDGKIKIKNTIITKLKSIVKRILAGWQASVLKDEQRNCKQLQSG